MFALVLLLLQFFPALVHAAQCATVDSATSAVYVVTTPVSECSALVLLDVTDWVGSSIWSLPTSEDVFLAWGVGFTLPVTLFLVAWAVGRVVHFFGD